ncbi:MAG: hypothetical protein GX087_11370 [Desulfobulbaceae bacterium]|nr:hypothetical protein [Desulfobulbaceae bacterium]
MGFFDTIERLNREEPPAVAPATPEEKPPQKTATECTRKPRGHKTRKPELLSFLRPCPICKGRDFLHLEAGGFVCQACTPGLVGHPVEATGPERPAPKQDDNHELPEGCSRYIYDPGPANTGKPTEQQLAHFAVAWPWIKKNKPALLAAGWTMAALVRRSKYRWPCGNWGVAWLPAWCKSGLIVAVVRNGEIQFSYPSCGKTISQNAYPPHHLHKTSLVHQK